MRKVAKELQADYVLIGGLTLHGIGKELYYKVVRRHFPELLVKYEQLFKIFNQPSKAYRLKLERRVRALFERYGVRRGIL